MTWSLSSPAAHAADVSKSVTVHIPRLQQGAVITVDPTHAMVSFGAPFASIQTITFHVVMEGDLLDTDEALLIDDKIGGQALPDGSPPMSEFSLTPDPETYHLWLDGHEVIHPEMNDKIDDHDDTVRIVEFTATIVGVR